MGYNAFTVDSTVSSTRARRDTHATRRAVMRATRYTRRDALLHLIPTVSYAAPLFDYPQVTLVGDHEPPKVSSSHKIEVPASMAHRLTPEQAELLQAHASAHGDSRHQLATVEKVRFRTGRGGVRSAWALVCATALSPPCSSWPVATRLRRPCRRRSQASDSELL